MESTETLQNKIATLEAELKKAQDETNKANMNLLEMVHVVSGSFISTNMLENLVRDGDINLLKYFKNYLEELYFGDQTVAEYVIEHTNKEEVLAYLIQDCHYFDGDYEDKVISCLELAIKLDRPLMIDCIIKYINGSFISDIIEWAVNKGRFDLINKVMARGDVVVKLDNQRERDGCSMDTTFTFTVNW